MRSSANSASATQRRGTQTPKGSQLSLFPTENEQREYISTENEDEKVGIPSRIGTPPRQTNLFSGTKAEKERAEEKQTQPSQVSEQSTPTEPQFPREKPEKTPPILTQTQTPDEDEQTITERGRSAERDSENQVTASEAAAAGINYSITNENIGAGTPKERYANNVAAIRLLKELEADGRLADEKEQEVLAKYVGWGGLASAFDENDNGWRREYGELKELLTEEEYRSARSSTLTSFYTPPVVSEAIYSTLDKLGFAGGNVLEPAMGTGNFFGSMPREMRDNSRLYGVEIDGLSGRIAKQLYQKANIEIKGYEKTGFDDNFFDVAVGNVPFGQFKVADQRYNKLNYSIHDYFFAKTLDKVRPGGVVAFVTSRYTMDKENPSVRRYIAQRADLLGAVRLPNNAFKGAAGTEVVSDILFLQKRERVMDVEPEWIFTGRTEDGGIANEYFLKHPEMVCGELKMESGPFGPTLTYNPIEGKDLGELLNAAVSNIEGRISEADIELDDGERRPEGTVPADPRVRNFSYTLVDGEIYYRRNSVMHKPPEAVGTRAERIKGLIGLRNCTRELIDYQLEGYSDEQIGEKQKELKELYDAFTSKYGIINSRGNSQAFGEDSGYYLLTSLEDLDSEGNLKGLADMFTKRTIGYKAVPEKVETAVEALAVSVAEKAEVDLAYMSELCDKSEEEIAEELQGVIFKNPVTERYETADEYLSGNVVRKLETARAVAKTNPEYETNVAALEQVQPAKLSAADIKVRLGSSWIDEKYVKQFIVELLEPRHYVADKLEAVYVPMTAEWRIEGKNEDKWNPMANQTYGTPQASAYTLIEDALNGKYTRITNEVTLPDGKKARQIDAEATAAAQAKQEEIKQKFKDWIFRDIGRREALVEKYNALFNNSRPRAYDGSHIAFNGMNPEISLEKHQRDAAARILYGPNTLLAHVVGAGKTFEMISAAMESRRLGIASKNMFVVPNHLTEQTASEFLRLYPAADILVATKKDFEKNNRKTFCSRIATGDYDAVILGFSQFEKIPISLENQTRFLQQQVDDITEGIAELKAKNGERISVKRYEAMRTRLEEKMAVLQQQMNERKDDVITFEELGVDRLFVDEAHNYKNLMTYTKMSNVAGISTTEAQKSADLFMKCRYLDEITGGKGVTFATGTPVSNSMVEMFTMQRYLQMSELEERGLTHFDAWASVFGETSNVLELAPEGNGYRMRTRFAKFFNLPELMNMFAECADIKTSDMLNLPVPTAHYENVVVRPSVEQLEMIGTLSERAEKVRARQVRPDEDNMLKITSDGRKIGLDQRLMDADLPDDPNSKVNACVNNVLRIWEESKPIRGTQLVFCDFSTPDPKKFNLYDDIKAKLTDSGVPASEIAFIHDADTEAKKAALFAKVREGHVRVLLGSTQKMGAGTNVQDRLVASHDLDCPWRPADLEQRAGRIVRQGNMNKDVYIYRYVTERTFDAYLYQTVEAKQKFIAQVMTSRSPLRSCEDMDESVLQYAEVKALCAGDPRIKEKMDLDMQVGRLTMLKTAYTNNRFMLEKSVCKDLPEYIAATKQNIKNLEADIAHIKKSTHIGEEEKFSPMLVGDILCVSRESAGKNILAAMEKANYKEYIPVGEYRGMKMYVGNVAVAGNRSATFMKLEGISGKEYSVELGDNAQGNITRINNLVEKIVSEYFDLAKMELDDYERKLATYAEELRKPFEHEEELNRLQARLNTLNAELNIDNTELNIGDDARRQSLEEEETEQNGEEIEENEEAEELPLASSRTSRTKGEAKGKIEDFGEKIGGAKKDDIVIKRNYQTMIDDGTTPKAAALIHALDDLLTAHYKPKNRKNLPAMREYAKRVETLNNFVPTILEKDRETEEEDFGKYILEPIATKLVPPHLADEFNLKVVLYKNLGHEDSLARYHIKPSSEKDMQWEVVKVNNNGDSTSLGYAEHSGELVEKIVDDIKRKRERRENRRRDSEAYYAYTYSGEKKNNGIYIGMKRPHGVFADLKWGFSSKEEAEEYIRTHGDELDALWKAYKQKLNERREENNPRIGPDVRGGKDVTPQMFTETFGFKGVEFGSSMGQAQRQTELNNAYEAFIDLASVMNLPPKALSLDGGLALAFGARGQGGRNAANAHYDPNFNVINLTRGKGAGSLAHEWLHAVDRYFGVHTETKGYLIDSAVVQRIRTILGDETMPENAKKILETVTLKSAQSHSLYSEDEIRGDVIKSFGKIASALENESKLVLRSAELDKEESKDVYWSKKTEMNARAFEAYVIDKLAQRGISNDYLANIVSEDEWKKKYGQLANYPYPLEDEMEVIGKAYDGLFETIKTRETDKGVEMYSLGKSELFQIEKESDAFAKQVDDFAAGKLGRYDKLTVMTTPLVMQTCDERVKPLPIVMSQRTLGKIFRKHNISPELVKELPKALSNPIMVFESERKEAQVQDGFLMMLDLKDKNGATVNVPIALNSVQGHTYECNVITSMYGRHKERSGKPKEDWFINQALKEGLVKYIDKEKLSRWLDDARLCLPGRYHQRESNDIVADSDDFVKQNQEIIQKILDANPKAKTEADLEASREKLDMRAALEAVSIDDVKARVKGAEVSDLGDGKMSLEFANGMKWLVDTRAEKININPDVVKRDYGRDVLPEDVVAGRTRIMNGKTFIDLVAGMSGAETFSHEVFEASWNILTQKERETLLNTYKTREAAADRYAAYLEGRVSGNASPSMAVFRKLKDFFLDIRASLFGRESEDIFRHIAEGKVYERKEAAGKTRENAERYELKKEEQNDLKEAVEKAESEKNSNEDESKEVQDMSEQDRKTATLAAGNDFVRKDFKHGIVKYGNVLGPIRQSERERNGEKEYFASFNLQSGGEVMRVRVMSKKPIEIKEHKDGQEPVFVSGQKFLVSPKDKEGKIIGPRVPVLYARAIHEAQRYAANEKGEMVKLQPPRAGKAIVSKEDSIHNELQSASREPLTGIIMKGKYNVFDKVLGQPDNPYGYESKFRLATPDRDKDGNIKKNEQGKTEYKIITVQCITKQPLNLENMISSEGAVKPLSLKGAYQMHDAKRPDNTVVRNVVTFDPVVISQYKEREKEKGKEAPKQEKPMRSQANVKDGIYKGQIVSQDVENAIFIQKIGSREYSHNAANLNVKPEVGKDVKIVYNNGKGTVTAVDKEKEQANER